MKKAKIVAATTAVFFLASMLTMIAPAARAPPNDMPPKGPHYDVNFVTGGKIAFTSTFEGSTTPTVPPFYWHDDFEDGDAAGWTTFGTGGIWAVEDDTMDGATTKVYSQSDTSWTTTHPSNYDTYWRSYAGDTGWSDYSVEAKIKVVAGGFAPIAGIFFRVQGFTGTSGYYLFRIDGRPTWGVALIKSANILLQYDYFEVTMGQVYELKVVLSGSNIKCYVDDVLKIEHTDTSYPGGAIGVGTFNAHAHFDDVTVLGATMPGQDWIGDGPWYTETRTITGTVTPVSGGPIAGSMTIESTSTLNAVTGDGTSSGTFTFANTASTGGFSGTIWAANTNFGTLDGTFVSTESTGIYEERIAEGTFNGYFYESTPGAGYDSFQATIVGTAAENEILVKYDGTVPGLAYVFGPEFSILDNDAGVFDGDCAVLQIPEGMIFDVYCSARGKPGGNMHWGCDHIREEVPAGKPTWHQHSPDNFDLRKYITYMKAGEFGPQLGPYSVTSEGCTILATRWYPQEIVYPHDWIVLPLYNWYDGCASPYDPGAYHPMTPEWYVGIMAFKASSGNLRVDIALTQGKPSKTYQVLLWYNYRLPGQGYWVIGTLTTGSTGRGSKTINYALTAGTYILGIDLMWDDGTSHQQILSAGEGVLGLQNSITIP